MAGSRVTLSGGASWPHPDAVSAAFEAVKPDVMTADWYLLREVVSLLDHLGRHPAGTGSTVAQVRQYRRALRGGR